MAKVREPPYATLTRDGAFEVRNYGPRAVAETTVTGDWNGAGNEGFRRLASYIFGKNRRREKIAMTAPVAQAPQANTENGQQIAMTAPVAQRGQGTSWTVAFTMPEGETLATLPIPTIRASSFVTSLLPAWPSCASAGAGRSKT